MPNQTTNEGEMKIIKIDKCLNCPYIAWTTYPGEPICNHDYYKDESSKIHRKRCDVNKYWKIENFDVVQCWCVLEDAE